MEAASTDTDQHGSANAYLAQVEHNSGDLAGRAYLREQQENFGLGQQATTEAGTRKTGAEGEYRISETLRARLDAFQQTNLVADRDRNVAESELVYQHGSAAKWPAACARFARKPSTAPRATRTR